MKSTIVISTAFLSLSRWTSRNPPAPFFDLPCSGIRCKSPLDIVVTELHAYGRAPSTLLRCLLYPGIIAQSFQKTFTGEPFKLPEWNRILQPLDPVIAKDPYAHSFPTSWEDFKDQDIDMIGGSFLVVAGGFMAILGPSAGGTVGLSVLAFYAMRSSWDGIEPISVLMIGAGEYTVGFVPTKEGAASDKSAGVIAITLMDLRRLGKVQRLLLCDRSGRHFPAIRETLKRKIADVYRDMDVTVETYPADDVQEDEAAYLAAMAHMQPGDMVTVFTPDNTHYPIALAAIQHGGWGYDRKPHRPRCHSVWRVVGREDEAAYLAAMARMQPGDMVTVFTPKNTRYPIALAAIQHGLHVLVAKPAVKTLQHHHHLVQAAEAEIQGSTSLPPGPPLLLSTSPPLPLFPLSLSPPSTLHHFFPPPPSLLPLSPPTDFHAWAVQGQSRPVVVVASAARGKATQVLQDVRGGAAGSVDVEDSITLMVQWQNKGGSCGTAVYTASWIAPPSDCHTQQHFHYMGHQGEVRVDQAHRGFTMSTDAAGFATLNPLCMKYTPDATGRFAGQLGYGYRSIADFVTAAQCINAKKFTVADVESNEMIATIRSPACLLTTVILEAGRKSLDMNGVPVSIEYDEEGRPITLRPASS
ncbi:unnamed protein product [Closterium sp. Yama58-4]|nr:unnamed protein product [Closterium sp. Yama58-4]